MIIPKKIKAGGHTYKVINGYHFKEVTDYVGQTDHTLLEIRLDNKDTASHLPKPISILDETFLHELLHIADRISGQHIFENNEKGIEGFSQCLYPILKDNKLKFYDD